jgi:hypothetical protein
VAAVIAFFSTWISRPRESDAEKEAPLDSSARSGSN